MLRLMTVGPSSPKMIHVKNFIAFHHPCNDGDLGALILLINLGVSSVLLCYPRVASLLGVYKLCPLNPGQDIEPFLGKRVCKEKSILFVIDTVPKDIAKVACAFKKVVIIDHHSGNAKLVSSLRGIPNISLNYDPSSKFGACMMIQDTKLTEHQRSIVHAFGAADTWNAEYFWNMYNAHPAEFLAGYKLLHSKRKRKHAFTIWHTVLNPQKHLVTNCIEAGRNIRNLVEEKRGKRRFVRVEGCRLQLETILNEYYGDIDHRVFISILMMIRSEEEFTGIVVFQSPGKSGFCSLRSVPGYALKPARALAEICHGNGHDHAAGAVWEHVMNHS